LYKARAMITRYDNLMVIPTNMLDAFSSSLFENVLAGIKMKSVADNFYASAITPPRFIKVLVPSMKDARSCICVIGVSILPLCIYLRSNQKP